LKKSEIKELLRLDKYKNEFISMISHELISPLVSNKEYAEILLKKRSLGQINEKQKKALQYIFRNKKKQGSLVEDILDCTKLELGQINLLKKDALISEIFTNVFNDCKPMIGEKQILIITKSNTRTISTVYCDQKRIEQILINLVKNSIDFVPEKDRKIILFDMNKIW
jgi:signal transduction histidine kinase